MWRVNAPVAVDVVKQGLEHGVSSRPGWYDLIRQRQQFKENPKNVDSPKNNDQKYPFGAYFKPAYSVMKHVNSSESCPLRVSGRCSRPLENLFPVPSSAHTLASEPSQTLIRKLKSINALKISRIIYDLTFCSSYWHIRATRGPGAARFCDGGCQESCSTSLLNLYGNMPAEKLKAIVRTGWSLADCCGTRCWGRGTESGCVDKDTGSLLF